LLGLGLTALPGQVPAQIAGPPAGENSAPAVIASSKPQKTVLPAEALLPPIDDGLRPALRPSATATARSAPSLPSLPRDQGVQHALYTSSSQPTPGKIDPNIVPTAAAPPPAAPTPRLESML